MKDLRRPLATFALLCCVGACSKQDTPSTEPPPAPPPSIAEPPSAEPAKYEPPAAEPAPAPAKAPEAEPAAAEPPAKAKPAAAPPPKAAAKPAAPEPEPEPQKAPAEVAAPSPAAATEPCGEKGQPRCPLQAWMEDHLQSALDKEDLKAAAAGLRRAARFAPDPSWNDGPSGWVTISNEAASAADSGDLAATQKACKSCHKAWRSKYKASFRSRALTL